MFEESAQFCRIHGDHQVPPETRRSQCDASPGFADKTNGSFEPTVYVADTWPLGLGEDIVQTPQEYLREQFGRQTRYGRRERSLDETGALWLQRRRLRDAEVISLAAP